MVGEKAKGAGHELREESVRADEESVGSSGYWVGEQCESQNSVFSGSGDDGVCNPRRRFGRHSHLGHIRIPPTSPGALDGYRGRHKQLVGDQCGQATVEYVVLLAGFACVAWGLGALWRVLESGLVVDHALLAASHQVQTTAMGLVDAFVF